MPTWQMSFVAGAYACALIAFWVFEYARTRRSGTDPLSVFMVLTLLQCVLPGVFIYALLPLVPRASPTTNPVLDRMLNAADLSSSLAVLGLTVWFLIFVYSGSALARIMMPADGDRTRYHVDFRVGAIVLTVAAGLALTLYSFSLLGDTFVQRYANLILYRAGFEGIERNALNANAFALTQTWSWLSIVALFAVAAHRGRGTLWILCLTAAVLLAILGVSRRALFLPLLLAYLTIVLHRGRWHWGRVAVAAVPLLLIVAFGKDAMAAFAWSGDVASVARTYESVASGLLRAVSEVGLSIVESVATLQYLDLWPRFGVDHVLSIARRFPEGMLGMSFDFPERIVRISTAAFAGSTDQDIPPGLAGQMWLDFRILGPLVWGLLFGLQIGIVQHWFERTERTTQAAALFVMAVFILALPVTTGSYDFTFSVDIVVLAVVLWLCVAVRRVRPVGAPSAQGAVA